MAIHKKFPTLAPWLIWGLAAFFFFAHYIVRVTPSQIVEELQATFIQSSNLDIGILGSAFYLPYVLMQMPVGYLVDKFGSRLLLTIAVFICSLSSIIFANATVLSTAIFARVLLGFCSATAFIGALKLITVWFEARQLALLVGITQALGMMGASIGSALVPVFNESIGWQKTFYGYGMVFFMLSVLIFTIVRNHPVGYVAPKRQSHQASFVELSSVLCNKYTWINALYAGFIYAPTDAMGELWGSQFLRHIHHVPANIASFGMALLFVGWAIGGPIAGWLADRFGRRPIMLTSSMLGFLILPIIFYVPNLPASMMMALTFLFGLTNTGLIASYTAAGELHSKAHAGFSMAIANMFSVLLGALLMTVIGGLLDWQATSHSVNGVLSYTTADYQRSALLLPLCMFLAIICAFFMKETLPIKHTQAN